MISEIESLLKEIEGLDGKAVKNKRNEYVRKIIEIQGLSSSNLSPQILFNSTNTSQQKQFIAACLLRLLCHNEKAVWEDLDFRNKTFILFNEQLAEIYSHLKIGEKTENHEKLSKLKDVEQKMLADFSSIAEGISSIKIALDSQNKIMQMLKRPSNKILLGNFVDSKLLLGEKLKELFDSLRCYEEAAGIYRMKIFNSIDNIFSTYLKDSEQSSSEFSVLCLRKLFGKIHNLIIDDFGKSDIIKPAIVNLVHPSRKYPLNQKDKQVELKFILENEGLGYAFNVQIEVLDAEDMTSEFNQVISSEMKVENFSVIIPAVVTTSKVKNPSLLIQWSWDNYDKTSNSREEIFEFEAQREDIDWDKLKFRRPYSLQAVETEEELVGRRDLIADIYISLISDSIESAMIFGQKRVGKTSIAKTLANKLLKEADIVPIFVKVGDLDKTSPSNFIKTLGDAIVEEALFNEELSKFEISRPVFTEVLSPPLATYFKRIKRVAPNLKFIIIIDEFDEIPSELYRYTQIGNTFFHNVRSLSQEGTQIGFILVGGENMQIIRQSTDRLNLFSPFQVDYFNRERFFGDFKELIKHPAQGILEFSDESIEEIYKNTEGNPFFTKFVCDKLFKQACDRKNSYISIDETKEAIIDSLESLDLINVNHFWKDAIWESQAEKYDLIETQRRKFLIAYAEIRRRNIKPRRQEIIESKILSDIAIDTVIEGFSNRGILLEEDGYFRLKPKLFDDWLVQRGCQLLTSSFSDANSIEELKNKEDKAFVADGEIVALTSTWDLYRSSKVTAPHVRAWLDQFADNFERRLMFKILQNITFYGEVKIREKLRVIHDSVRKNMVFSVKDDERRAREILLSSFDKPTKSSSSYARMYATENKIISTNVASLDDISKKLKEDTVKRISALVFIDDIIASGGSIITGLKELNQKCGEVIAARNMKVVVATICGLESGKETVEKAVISELLFKVEIYVCDVLNDSNRCFTDESIIFEDESERRGAREIAFKYGARLQKKQPLGFDGGQLLVVFQDNCPNNSLPILWASSESSWTPLFKRN